MNKIFRKFVPLVFVSFVLTLFLAFGMSHWMKEEPLHHGEHECCDFLPMSTNEPVAVDFLPLLYSLGLLSFFVYQYKCIDGGSRLRISHVPPIPPSRRLLKGVVQLE